jgi:hypothetical protein
MTDAGDLGRLPPEIRKEVFTYLLVEGETIQIKRFLGTKSKRKYDTAALRSWRTRRASEIFRVNKLIREEAAQVLYGCNKFEFINAGALYHFLQQIGDARRHLRHVAIYQDGLTFMKSWKSMQQSIQVLASVRGLRTLEVSHDALCRNVAPKTTIKALVQSALQATPRRPQCRICPKGPEFKRTRRHQHRPSTFLLRRFAFTLQRKI